MTGRQPPVTDWKSDFDHTDPTWVSDPYPIWADLRAHCPVAHSGRYGGTWLPTTHELVSEVAYDTEHFTSRAVVVDNLRPTELDLPAPIGLAPPITSDPPFHAVARRMLLPAFAPRKIASLEPMVRKLCGELLDATSGRSEFDAAVDYTQHIPVGVIVGMLGFPLEDADIFRRFITQVLEKVDLPGEERLDMFMQGEIEAYLNDQIESHRAHPRDDLTSFLLEAEIDGNKLAIEHVRGTMILLMVAGIDTTWSAIGASLWHLGSHPEDRRKLASDISLWPTAIEEFLRAYAPVTMGRLVIDDFDFHGHRMLKDDWVLLPFPSANRDETVFPDASRVLLDRQENRHAAFGLGIHRCLGSNLARMELTVALKEWMARYPEFELSDPDAVTWSGGQVRGPRSLPVRILA